MDKVLSKEEINALFSAMSSDAVDLDGQPAKNEPARKIVNYDFHRADRISQDQMRSIHMLHEYFGRNFASSLSAYLRSFVEVELASVEQMSYAAFLKKLGDPTLFCSIGMRPLDGNMALELEPSLVFPMIDMILGGPGLAAVKNRNLTEIELNIIEGVIKVVMRDLRTAWLAIIDLDLFLEGKGTKGHMFQIVSPGETVIAVHFELKVADFTGAMNICIPSGILKLLRNKFDQQWNVRRHKASGDDAVRILEHMKMARFPLTGEIINSKMTVSELLKVAAGDVVVLNQRVDDPLALCVGGKVKLTGRVVQRRGKKAFEVDGRVSN
ncbi:MAG TPA: flagellar motor switch protein FliM [Acidobacteriota bacterium]|nr:flagellar motor switch protein FliM [Acidobacteriota bacterium]